MDRIYRSRKVVQAIKVKNMIFDDMYDSYIKELKKFSKDIKVEVTKLKKVKRDESNVSIDVSIYNRDFDVYIPVKIGEWIVSDPNNKSLIIMTDSEFESLYEDMNDYDQRLIGQEVMSRVQDMMRPKDHISDWSSWTRSPYSQWIYNGNTYTSDPGINTISVEDLAAGQDIIHPLTSDLASSGELNVLSAKDIGNSINSVNDELTNLKSQINDLKSRLDVKDSTDAFIENYVTPNGN